MLNIVEIYNNIRLKIKEIDLITGDDSGIRKELMINLEESSKEIENVLLNLESEITKLEEISEWDNYTISFIGETNAGKSTIIEALRIKYLEKEKEKDYINNSNILKQEQELKHSLIENEKLFKTKKENFNKAKEIELTKILEDEIKLKSSFFFKIRKFFQRDYEPFKSKILFVRSEIRDNLNRDFDTLPDVLLNRKRLNELRNSLKYDGDIIGDGRLDFTQKSESFFIKINEELVRIIDVPGIEGNEKMYEEEIKKAVSESHCVFYVTSSSKTLEQGTLSKVKKYIKDQADVYAIVNLRLNQYKNEFNDLSFTEIYKNKLESIQSVREQLQEQLQGNFIDVILLNGHWAFLGLSKYLEIENKFYNDKNKLVNIFNNDGVILEKANFESIERSIFSTISNKESKIYRVNILKINTLIDRLIDDLQANREKYLNTNYLREIDEQSKIAQEELSNVHKDFLKDLSNVRIRLINNFKRKIFEEITLFVEKNEINESVYKSAFSKIVEDGATLLRKNIEEDLENSNSKAKENTEKVLAKFIDRLDTLTKADSIKFSNTDINVNYDFLKSDLKKLGKAVFSIGSMAFVGFSVGGGLGSIVLPVIGSVSGAILGAILGAFVGVLSQVIQFFQSTESKKAKILSKVDEQISLIVKNVDIQLNDNFLKISKDFKDKVVEENITLVKDFVMMYHLREKQITHIEGELKDIKIEI